MFLSNLSKMKVAATLLLLVAVIAGGASMGTTRSWQRNHRINNKQLRRRRSPLQLHNCCRSKQSRKKLKDWQT